jgi:hypothetical protein
MSTSLVSNKNKHKSKTVSKQHQKYLRSQYNQNLWDSFATVMDINHRRNLNKCITLGDQENYLNGVSSLFKQLVSNYKIPHKVVIQSDAYSTLGKLTKFNVYSNKHGRSIQRCITQLEMCAIRKTTSKRSFMKNKLILKRELTCVQHASRFGCHDHVESEWQWVDTQYHKHMTQFSSNTSNKWAPVKKWTLVQSK